MRVLLVDDKASVRNVMKQILMELGMDDITEAIDGEEAWNKINSRVEKEKHLPFELIVSDLEMPKMSGLDLLRAVRNNRRICKIPFIMATTVTKKTVILETMRLGVQAYIIKPFDSSMVEHKLKQAGIL